MESFQNIETNERQAMLGRNTTSIVKGKEDHEEETEEHEEEDEEEEEEEDEEEEEVEDNEER